MLRGALAYILLDWSLDHLKIIHDRDLRGLGNLYKRLHAAPMCEGRQVGLPSVSSGDPLEKELASSLMAVTGEVTEAMKSLTVARAIDAIMVPVDIVSPSASHNMLECLCPTDKPIPCPKGSLE